jgi:5-methylcytosine-specific restriction endonuclease McrA
MSHSINREIYGFDPETKKQALEKSGFRCEVCGSTEHLEVNHLVAIWFAVENPCLIPAVIKSIANTQILCHPCHAQSHLNESRAKYAEIAPKVLDKYLQAKIDPHKDDWRDKLKTVVTERR